MFCHSFSFQMNIISIVRVCGCNNVWCACMSVSEYLLKCFCMYRGVSVCLMYVICQYIYVCVCLRAYVRVCVCVSLRTCVHECVRVLICDTCWRYGWPLTVLYMWWPQPNWTSLLANDILVSVPTRSHQRRKLYEIYVLYSKNFFSRVIWCLDMSSGIIIILTKKMKIYEIDDETCLKPSV